MYLYPSFSRDYGVALCLENILALLRDFPLFLLPPPALLEPSRPALSSPATLTPSAPPGLPHQP